MKKSARKWCWLVAFAVAAALPRTARADSAGPADHVPRGRLCCALAANLPLHLGDAHVPINIAGASSPRALGHHSYLPGGALTETTGLVYTRRGGFIDLAHTRENADIAAYIALHLRPLLARGDGTLTLSPEGAERRIRIIAPVPAEELARTSDLIAARVAFELSIWVELVQYYGLVGYPGATEAYSSFSPEDLYSNLLGVSLGITALESPVPYDQAMDVALASALLALDVTSATESQKTLQALSGRWWDASYAWPAAEIAILRTYEIGPKLAPVLAPPDIAAATLPAFVQSVPETDPRGEPLGRFYRLEVVPHPQDLPSFPAEEVGRPLGEADFPRLVDGARRGFAMRAQKLALAGRAADEAGVYGEVRHYISGIRLLELSGAGGLNANAGGSSPAGAGGGSLLIVRGDTRSGDFGLMDVDVMHTAERGLIGGVSFFRADAVWFCHDPETARVRAPLVSLLGPCAPGEWIGIGGSIGEAIHDGGTGRTALRPLSLAAVFNPLRNGQSPSYDYARVLLRAGGEIEHIWAETGGARTIPRTGANLSSMFRTPSRRVEVRGAVGYRLDPAAPRDAAFESKVAARYNFLLGGTNVAPLHDRIDPWGVAALGIEGGYSYWTRPQNADPELAAPFVSAEQSGTWQLLITAALGFESLSF